MSWNIVLGVDEHGKVTIDEERSYTSTAPRNCRILVGGHVVGDEGGSESLSVALTDNETGYTKLQAGTYRTKPAENKKAVDPEPDEGSGVSVG